MPPCGPLCQRVGQSVLGLDQRCDIAGEAERADDPAHLVAERHLRARHPGVVPALEGLALDLPDDGPAGANDLLLVLMRGERVLVAEDVEIGLADQVVEAQGDYAAAFRAYQQARYLRTGRVQIMARVYGEFYHAAGVAKELRNGMLSSRTPEDAMAGMEWLYGEQTALTRSTVQAAAAAAE